MKVKNRPIFQHKNIQNISLFQVGKNHFVTSVQQLKSKTKVMLRKSLLILCFLSATIAHHLYNYYPSYNRRTYYRMPVKKTHFVETTTQKRPVYYVNYQRPYNAINNEMETSTASTTTTEKPLLNSIDYEYESNKQYFRGQKNKQKCQNGAFLSQNQGNEEP